MSDIFVDIRCTDCLGPDGLPSLPDNSVDLIVTDPPYYRVKNEPWDRQWESVDAFIEWIRRLCEQWYRILKPNGSLYVFASPKMAARVEVTIAERFNVLNRIRWIKREGWHNKADKEALRSYLSPWEEIIFAEHYGADNIAKGEAGYAAKCDELKGFLFEPIRAYLDGERLAARLDFEDVRRIVGCAPGSGLPSHWFTRSQWILPTAANYAKLQQATGRFQRPYEELRREYEELRRPFSVTADVPYTDVWDFPTVRPYAGKHPCEKPVEMLEHIIRVSSRPGAVVLDCFMGSGSTGEAAVRLGRSFIGMELSPKWTERARQRIARVQSRIEQMRLSV